MKISVLENRQAPVKWWAAQDARIRNYANSTLYTEVEKVRAERMKLALEMVYLAKKVYIAYGKKGISVKVDAGVVSDAETVKLLEQDWAAQGVTKKITGQGVIYRF